MSEQHLLWRQRRRKSECLPGLPAVFLQLHGIDPEHGLCLHPGIFWIKRYVVHSEAVTTRKVIFFLHAGGTCTACGTTVWCINGQSNSCPQNSQTSGQASALAQCLCNPGYYGDTTMSSLPFPQLCQVCKMDNWCPGGAVNASQVCPDGKYSLPGSDAVNDCNCPDHSSSQQKSSEPKQCVCESGYYREYNPAVPLGGWTCTLCKPGEFCYDNTNKTCPQYSTSLGVAKSVLDCFCLPGFANASTQTEQKLCVECPANSYCTGKGEISQCVSLAVSPAQSTGPGRCYCSWGYKGINNSACEACQSPTFCYGGIQAQCFEGTFSSPLSWSKDNCSCIAGWWGPVGKNLHVLSTDTHGFDVWPFRWPVQAVPGGQVQPPARMQSLRCADGRRLHHVCPRNSVGCDGAKHDVRRVSGRHGLVHHRRDVRCVSKRDILASAVQ